MDIAAEFMSAIVNPFEANKRLADRTVEQVPDDKLHVPLDANTNSIAVIMKHVAGNLASRWTRLRFARTTHPSSSGESFSPSPFAVFACPKRPIADEVPQWTHEVRHNSGS